MNLMDPYMQQKRPFAKVGAGQVGHAVLGAKALRLLTHVLDQLRPQNAFGKSRKVLDQSSHRELPARFVALDHQWLQVGPRRVKSGRVSGAPGSDDDNVSSFAHGWLCSSRLDGRFQFLMQALTHTQEMAHFFSGTGAALVLAFDPVLGLDSPAICASSSGTIFFTLRSAR